MSVKILSESAISFERTLVYQTVFENFVVLIQQKRKNDLWYTYQHCLIPKLFINAIAALPEKTEPAESSVITSGGHLPPKTIPQMHSTEETLPEEVRRILYRYDCDCVPLFENQLGTFQAYENLGDMWGVKSSPSSPDSQPPSVSVSVPTTPAVDPSPTFTPNPSPSLFEDFQRKNKISDNFASQFDVNILSGSNFQTPQPQTNSADVKTPNCSETPVVCAAPKKRKQEDSLMDFFDL